MDIEAPFIVIILMAAVALYLFIWRLVCREFGLIAEEKGYPARRYFHFCFWLGLVGMLMVIALPDRSSGKTPERTGGSAASVPVAFPDERKATLSPAKPAPSHGASHPTGSVADSWRCSCGAANSMTASLCSSCRALWHCTYGKLNSRRDRRCATCGAWRCTCGKLNPASRGACDSCGEPKPR